MHNMKDLANTIDTAKSAEQMIQDMLADYRKARGFNVDSYITKKVNRINKFFADNKLNAAVIGISGGVDSAVAYKLLVKASQQKDSPIKRIDAVLMPIHCEGTTGQVEATTRGLKVVSSDYDGIKYHYFVDDLTDACEAYVNQIQMSLTPNAWSIGQLASVVRTPHLYFRAALLQQLEYKSIVVGTTNRDEGSYIGFFGKASDAMVDLQPIADIHKSEVYQVAEKLKVPREVIDEKPRGDVWDNKVDEEMIGAPYWFLEYMLLWKSKSISKVDNNRYVEHINWMGRVLDTEYGKQITEWHDNINAIHDKNKHKYEVGNPAHFIDVMERKIPGGWQ